MVLKKQTPSRKALNTFAQGLVFDVLVAFVLGVALVVEAADSWADVGGGLIAFSFAKSLIVAGLTYVMRNYVDRWRARAADIDWISDDDLDASNKEG